jgi:hypothetical protein
MKVKTYDVTIPLEVNRKLTKVKLTKIAVLATDVKRYKFLTGNIEYGVQLIEPTVGKPYWLSNFKTTTVTKILSENTFETLNSVYKWEVIDD